MVASSLSQWTGKKYCSPGKKLDSNKYKWKGADLFAVGRFLTHCVGEDGHMTPAYSGSDHSFPSLTPILKNLLSWELCLSCPCWCLLQQAVLNAATRVMWSCYYISHFATQGPQIVSQLTPSKRQIPAESLPAPHNTGLPTTSLPCVSIHSPSLSLLQLLWPPCYFFVCKYWNFFRPDMYLKMELLNQSISTFSRYCQTACQMGLPTYIPTHIMGDGWFLQILNENWLFHLY